MNRFLFLPWNGVLDQSSYKNVIADIAKKAGANPELVATALLPFTQDYFEGRIQSQTIITHVATTFKFSVDDVVSLFAGFIAVKPNVELWNAMPRIMEHYNVAILSDTPREKVEAIANSVDLSKFCGAYFSSMYRVPKRDPTLFTIAVTELASKGYYAKSKQTIIVDPDSQFCALLQKRGHRTYQYTGVEALLKEIGIKTPRGDSSNGLAGAIDPSIDSANQKLL